jgi:heat shock protein HslJ
MAIQTRTESYTMRKEPTMVRILTCIVAATFLSAGLGCGLQQQSNPVTATVSPPAKAADIAELTAASEIDVDPAQMTLNGKEWSWIRTVYNNDKIVTPAKPGVFTLTFKSNSTVNAATDCNRMTGSYSIDGRLLSFSKLAATRMYCPDSQEGEFADMLSQVAAFLFTSKGELVLELKLDSGQMLFK